MNTFQALLWASLLAVLTQFGCGRKADYGPTGQITGTLTCDDQPLGAGYSVTFMEPLTGYLAFGITDAQSNFKVDSWNKGRMPIGKYSVQVTPPSPADLIDEMSAEDAFEAAAKPTKSEKLKYHKRYISHTSSNITAQIQEGMNTVAVNVTSK